MFPGGEEKIKYVNLLQLSVAFHTVTSRLVCNTNFAISETLQTFNKGKCQNIEKMRRLLQETTCLLNLVQ